jgi:ATP-dependent DNA ligase
MHYPDHIVGKGEALFEKFCAADLEGVISKRADAPYVGSQAGTWLKTKCIKRQEFVIAGWTSSDKGRGFRSLLLGVHGVEGGAPVETAQHRDAERTQKATFSGRYSLPSFRHLFTSVQRLNDR